MRSFARARSSSRRAPPNAASKPCSSIASSSVTVCSRLRDARGPVSSTARPASIGPCTGATMRSRPGSATARSRNSITSGKLCPVSTCITGNGTRPGAKAFAARCDNTIESLPPEYSSTGFSSSAATSRMMWIASASSASRWGSARVTSVMRSDRALALAPDDLERHVAVPVDELVHRLQAELDGHREVAHGVLELLGADARGVGVEDLALLALGLVLADPALDGLGHALGGQAHLQTRPVDDLAAFVITADVRDVGRDRVLAD